MRSINVRFLKNWYQNSIDEAGEKPAVIINLTFIVDNGRRTMPFRRSFLSVQRIPAVIYAIHLYNCTHNVKHKKNGN